MACAECRRRAVGLRQEISISFQPISTGPMTAARFTSKTGLKGETHLFRVDVASKETVKVTSGPRAVRGVDLNDKTRKMVYTANDFKHLDDLYVADLSG